jgi:hypothetical protein
MITDKAQQRMRILIHWEKHGMPSAMDAFKVSERTRWNWRRAFYAKKKLESLNEKKRTPKKKRVRT